MSTLASLRILLGLDAGGVKVGGSEARAEMAAIRADAQRTATSVNTVAADMGRSFNGVGASVLGLAKSFAGVAAVTSAGALFADSIKGAIEEEAGIARLNASLKANASVREGTSDAIERQIKANENLGFADDATRDSLTGLVAATHDVNEALAVQSTAMDLARFKHISLQDASDALVKVEGGRFRLLAGLGIQLEANATKEEALAAVQKVAAGQAADFGNTAAGAGEAAAAAFHDAEEALGTAFLPLLKETASVVKDDLAPALRDLAGGVVEVVKFGNDIAGVFNEIVALGPKVHDAIFGARPSAEDIAGERAATKAAQDYSAELHRIDIAVADGTMTQDQAAAATIAASDAYRVAIGVAEGLTRATGTVTDSLKLQSDTALTAAEATDRHGAAMDLTARAALALTVKIGTSAGATDEQKQAAQDAMAAFKALGTVFDGFNGTVTAASAHMGVYSADLDNTGMRAAGLKQNVDDLRASLGLLPTDVEIAINITETTTKRNADAILATQTGAKDFVSDAEKARRAKLGEGPGAGVSGSNQAGGVAVTPFEWTPPPLIDPNVAKWNADQKAERERLAHEAQSERDRAAREAEQKARDSARQQASDYRDAMSAAYDKISADAHKVFDAVHAANLKIIRDAQDTANAQIEAQEKAIRGFVTGEQAKLDAERAHRRELELRADVANAVSPEDRARAQQSLNDFLADQRITFLSAQADTQVAALDAAKAANDATAAAQTQAENDRFKQQTTEFDKALKALADGLKKHPELWKSSQENVLKLLMSYSVPYQAAGAAAGLAYAKGLLSASLAVEQAARGVAVAAARAEGNIVIAPPVVPKPVIPAPDIPSPVTLATPIVPTPVIPTPPLPPALTLYPPVVPTPVVPTPVIPPAITLPAPVVAASPIDYAAAADALKAWTTAQDDTLALLNSHIGDFGNAGKAQGTAYAEALLGTRDAVAAAAKELAAAAQVTITPPAIDSPRTLPGPAVPTADLGAVPERSVQSQITPMGEWAGGGKFGDVYLDAEKVGEFYAKRGATLDAIYNPVPVSIGPKR